MCQARICGDLQLDAMALLPGHDGRWIMGGRRRRMVEWLDERRVSTK